jgi:subtilase family serine protease
MRKGWILVGLLTAAVAHGQYGRDVVVPRTTLRVRGEPAKKVHTNHLIYVGPWRQRGVSGDYPQLLASLDPRAAVQTIAGYHPADIRAAYNVPANSGNQAIAIVDAYHLPTALNDFNVFSRTFGLPQETSTSATASTNTVFQVVYATGSQPAVNADWGGEIALDIEWAHAVAPKAKIILVEAATDSLSDMMDAVRVAAAIPEVRQISMSFGTNEFSTEQQLDSIFSGTNKVYFGSAGDASNQVSFPAVSPKVVGVGGTRLTFSGGAAFETAWNSSGGGPSVYVPRPSYQDKVANVVGAVRGTPDISAVADPETGCAVYDSTPIPETGSGWLVFGGTSLAAPVCAGIINVRGFYPASSLTELARQYGLLGTSSLRDVTSGVSGRNAARVGYDFVTGVGSPLGIYANVSASPTGVIATLGTPVQGVPSNVVAKDNHDYVLRSVSSGSTQQVILSGSLTPNLPAGSVVYGSTISVTGMKTGGTATLSLQNPGTGAWTNVGALNFGLTNTTVVLTVPNPATFVNSSGTLKFRISGTGSSQFRLGIDQVLLTATPSA